MTSSRCKSCQAAIIWVVTDRGQAMPVDAMPLLLGGSIELIEQTQGDPVARVLGTEARGVAGRPLYVSHFVNCPQAGQHRKKLQPDGRRR